MQIRKTSKNEGIHTKILKEDRFQPHNQPLDLQENRPPQPSHDLRDPEQHPAVPATEKHIFALSRTIPATSCQIAKIRSFQTQPEDLLREALFEFCR